MNDATTNGSIDLETVAEQQAEAVSAVLAPGQQLAEQRQALNWSIEQVANQLNLAPRQIQAIESGNYAVLPGTAIVRGFIRSYAKLLKMDAAPLLLHLADKTTAANDIVPIRRVLPKASFSDSRLSSNRYRMASKPIILALLCIGIVTAIIIGHQAKLISVLPEPLALKLDRGLVFLSTSMHNLSAPGVTSTAAADTPKVGDHPDQALAASGMVSTELTNARDGGNKLVVLQPVAVDMAASASGPALTQPAVNTKEMLVLKLREDSWIEIKKSDRSTLIARLVKAGSTEAFDITEPVSLTVGNASGVDAILRGTPLTLLSGAKNNVARLTLK